MTRTEAIAEIMSGRFTSVECVKRSDGSTRKMLCRYGVWKHANGNGQAFDPVEKKLLVVYDLQAKGYRSIGVDGITRVKVNGKWEDVQ